MGLRERCARLLQRELVLAEDGVADFGQAGEHEVAERLAARCGPVYRGKLLPAPRRAGSWLEADLLVYVGGTLYAVEVKSYRGVLAWSDDGHELVKTYRGRTQTFRDPLEQASGFLERLAATDARFDGVPRVPVVAFRDDPHLDARAVLSSEGGYVKASQLPAFFAARAGGSGGAPWWRRLLAWAGLRRLLPMPVGAPWVAEALAALPSWDRVVLVDGRELTGLLSKAEPLVLGDRWGRPVPVALGEVASLDVTRRHRLLRDRVRVRFKDGREQTLYNLAEAVCLSVYRTPLVLPLRQVMSLEVQAG